MRLYQIQTKFRKKTADKNAMDDFELELKQDFLEESDDLLVHVEGAFLRLETERDNPEIIDEIFRLAHNLKGTAKAVGFQQLSDFTHKAENLILKIKESEIQATDSVVTALLSFKDKVEEMVSGLKENLEAEFDVSSEEAQIEACLEGSGPEDDSSQEVVSPASEFLSEVMVQEGSDSSGAGDEFQEEDVNFDEAFATAAAFEDIPEESSPTPEVKVQEAPLDSIKEKEVALKSEPTLVSENAEGPAAHPVQAPQPKKTVAKKNDADEESIRVKLSRIDKLNNIVGELVILHTILGQRRFEHIKDELSNKSISQMGKLFKEAQEISMSLRMVPLKPTFQKMTRIVRDISNETGKSVNLVLSGEETEIDKTVLESLGDPLVHIVRNAVDHGLESSEKRISAGKPEKGSIEISAFHQGSQLVIEISDDGGGIPVDIIRNKAISKGLIGQNENLSDEQVFQLIFHPGFSTKEQVTEISGRGVGMDVVKTNIEKLGGEVHVSSLQGKGSKFKIVLPLTLAIIEGMVLQSGEQYFVVPLSQVFELVHVPEDQMETFTGSAKLFRLRGEILPVFYLNTKVGEKVTPKFSEVVIVIRGLNHPFGVVVDDIIRQQQVVIKMLGEDIQGKKGFMGSAIMGDGKASFILDLFELFRSDIQKNQSYQKFSESQAASA